MAINKRLINPGFEAPTPPVPTSFNTITWDGESGNGSRDFSGVGFQPDLVWVKRSSSGDDHHIYDSVRGPGVTKVLASNKSAAEPANASSIYGYLDGFLPDGFSTVSGSNSNAFFNENGQSMVAWCWKAGGAAVTNTDGSITSQVSANTGAGFSVVSYSGGNSSGTTVGHGLGKSLDMLIVKNRTNGTHSWITWHKDVERNSTSTDTFTLKGGNALALNLKNTTFSYIYDGQMGSTGGENLIAYCFAEVAGFSKFGSYTGTGNTSGPTVSTGFEVAFLLVKKATGGIDDWFIFDNKRTPVGEAYIKANSSDQELDYGGDFMRIDATDGFQPIWSSPAINASGETYIYMAFANQF